MRKWCFSLAVLSVFFLATSQESEVLGDEYGRTGSLIILVKSSKPAYEIGEPISLTLTLSNHTTVPLIVNQRFFYQYDLEMDLFHEPFGRIPFKALPATPLKAEDYAPLAVDEQIIMTLPELTEIVAAPLKEGRYSLRIFYQNEQSPKGKDTWTGRIVTNRIWFTIKPSEKI